MGRGRGQEDVPSHPLGLNWKLVSPPLLAQLDPRVAVSAGDLRGRGGGEGRGEAPFIPAAAAGPPRGKPQVKDLQISEARSPPPAGRPLEKNPGALEAEV